MNSSKYLKTPILNFEDFPGGSDGKVSAYNVGDLGSIPGLGRPPGEGNGNPLQYSCLEGYSPWGHQESDMTEQLHFLSFSTLGLPQWLNGKEPA